MAGAARTKALAPVDGDKHGRQPAFHANTRTAFHPRYLPTHPSGPDSSPRPAGYTMRSTFSPPLGTACGMNQNTGHLGPLAAGICAGAGSPG